MLKVSNISKQELKRIGIAIGEAFAAENDGFAKLVKPNHLITIFEIVTEYYYRANVLYTLSDEKEAFVAFWFKDTKVAKGPALHMIFRLIKEVPFISVIRVAGSASELFAQIYKNEQNYLAISMLVVLQPFQGQGLMHKVLAGPFQIARDEKIPCVLDTDTRLKVEKYKKCGMNETGKKKFGSGVFLYTMEYRE